MQNSAHLPQPRAFFSFSRDFRSEGTYLTCRICCMVVLLYPRASPEPAHVWCHLPNVLSRNTGSVEAWEEAEVCELVFKNTVCNGFYCWWDLHWLLTSALYFFNSQSRRIGCLSNLQYSCPTYISMLLKYQGTNDMWHQRKTRRLRPTFLAHL